MTCNEQMLVCCCTADVDPGSRPETYPFAPRGLPYAYGGLTQNFCKKGTKHESF